MMSRFRAGDRVRVRVGSPPRHVRTPCYVQGKIGRVERLHGAYRNPESLAYGGDGLPRQALYLVRFPQSELWAKYAGSARDQLLIDIYEHWLEPA
ncbi:MAG: nitrile hydratase subunit beta [Candidatus Rokubacteria bacterium]|nr:nitrile hydratase subunit beta [Candidatus Rokubacteria bacterium]